MSERIDDWATHLPLLTAAVSATTGTVLELGAGLYSTPVLHAMCAPSARPLVTMETDAAWLNRFAPLVTPWHKLVRVTDWESTTLPECDVVLVDHGPAPRGPVAMRVKSRLFVFHDSECVYCGYDWAQFDWVATDMTSPTWTTLAGYGVRPAWLDGMTGLGFEPPVCYRG